MPDYKALYHTLFHATENAINLLIAASANVKSAILRQKTKQQKRVRMEPNKIPHRTLFTL